MQILAYALAAGDIPLSDGPCSTVASQSDYFQILRALIGCCMGTIFLPSFIGFVLQSVFYILSFIFKKNFVCQKLYFLYATFYLLYSVLTSSHVQQVVSVCEMKLNTIPLPPTSSEISSWIPTSYQIMDYIYDTHPQLCNCSVYRPLNWIKWTFNLDKHMISACRLLSCTSGWNIPWNSKLHLFLLDQGMDQHINPVLLQ